MIARLKSDAGQTMGFVAIALTFLLGMTALVLDIGAWVRADRHLQSVVDAAVLAGAQALPREPGEAVKLAQSYADSNDGNGTLTELAVFKDMATNDSIRATATREVPGFFSQVLKIKSMTVRASAAARASTPAAAKWVAPIAVSEKHPMLHCTAPGKCDPEFHETTTIDLVNLHKPGGSDAAGAFGLINLVKGDKGTVGESTIAKWVDTGFDETMTTGVYNSVPSAMFNASGFRSALEGRIAAGTEMYFPIYRSLVKSGSNAEYEIVGWIPFVVTKIIGGGDSSTIEGYFKTGIVEGVPGDATTGTPDFGTYTVSLTK